MTEQELELSAKYGKWWDSLSPSKTMDVLESLKHSPEWFSYEWSYLPPNIKKKIIESYTLSDES